MCVRYWARSWDLGGQLWTHPPESTQSRGYVRVDVPHGLSPTFLHLTIHGMPAQTYLLSTMSDACICKYLYVFDKYYLYEEYGQEAIVFPPERRGIVESGEQARPP